MPPKYSSKLDESSGRTGQSHKEADAGTASKTFRQYAITL
jgi:hypothetical protein